MASSVGNPKQYGTKNQTYNARESSFDEHCAKHPHPSLLEIRKNPNLTVEELTRIEIAAGADVERIKGRLAQGLLRYNWQRVMEALSEDQAIVEEVRKIWANRLKQTQPE